VGESVTQAFLNATGPPTIMTWSVVSSLRGDSDIEDAVVSEKAWMIVASEFLIFNVSINTS
jgi:hypothetical protein